MKIHHLLYGLLLLSGLASATNGVTELSSQQKFLNQRDQQAQQQRMLNNQQLDQRRLQQQRQFDNNQQQLLRNSPNGGQLLPNGNQPRNPFDRTTPAVPQAPLPAPVNRG
jgi:type II secretory pathway pseudopilin PulG